MYFLIFFFQFMVLFLPLACTIKHVVALDLYHSQYARSSDFKYCPASSLIDTGISGLHGYPMDIFDPDADYNRSRLHERAMLRRRLKIVDEPDDQESLTILLKNTYNCTSKENPRTFHKCSTLTKCPLSKNAVLASTNASKKWQIQHSFCSLRDTMTNYEKEIRIFTFGGSVTSGGSTYGCCCDRNLDNKCSFHWVNNIHHSCSDLNSNHDCRWSNSFFYWLKSISHAKVTLYNFAVNGATSLYMVELISNQMAEYNIKEFHTNDIIFIDHSVNDATALAITESTLNNLHYGLELLIKKILTFSTINSWPTIILMEIWPFSSYHRNMNRLKVDYQKIYRLVAKEFKLPIWSYRDTVDYMVQHNSTHPAIPFLTFQHNDALAFFHPPWFIHLFITDLLAVNFMRELYKCHYGNGTSTESRLNTEMKPSMIPKGVWKEKDQCDPNVPVYMDMSARNTIKRIVPEIPGSVRTQPEGSWKLLEDRPGKYGWVVMKSTNVTNHQTSSLIFSFPANNHTMKRTIVFKFHYLRTYQNAGRITVFVCGIPIPYGEFDALWSDYKTNRISVPVTAIVLSRFFCLDKTIPIDIEFRHTTIVPNDVEQNRLSSIDLARGNEKFKIIAVKACAELDVHYVS